MQTRWSLGAAVLGLFLVGCSAGPQTMDEGYIKDSKQYTQKRIEIMNRAKRVPWDQVSQADKDEFIKTFSGNETEAKSFWNDIVTPRGPGASMAGTASGARMGGGQ